MFVLMSKLSLAAQVSNQASWLKEENREPDWSRVSWKGQEQPSDLQLPRVESLEVIYDTFACHPMEMISMMTFLSLSCKENYPVSAHAFFGVILLNCTL